jgi:hypothetical protein
MTVPGTAAQPSPDIVSVTNIPTTRGGLDVFRNLNLGATGQVVKASAGQLFGWYISNAATSQRFLKVYNKATAADQTDTPVMTIPIPAESAANVSFPQGIQFAAGISVRCTTGIADNDTGAPGSNECVVNILFK